MKKSFFLLVIVAIVGVFAATSIANPIMPPDPPEHFAVGDTVVFNGQEAIDTVTYDLSTIECAFGNVFDMVDETTGVVLLAPPCAVFDVDWVTKGYVTPLKKKN